MAVRNFDGSDDTIQWSTGDVSGMTFGVVAAIVRFDVVASIFPTIGALHNSGGTVVLDFYHDATGGVSISWPTGSINNNWGTGTLSTATWYLLTYRKGTGSLTGRYSVFNFMSDTWTHVDGTPAIADWASSGAGGSIRQTFGVGDFLDGQMAARAYWTNDLHWTADASGDTALEAAGLHTAAQNWVDEAPDAFWLFNQATVTAVDDIIGGADQTSVTGTDVVVGSDPDGFDFTLAGPAAPNLRLTRSNLQLR